jgi:hypothetical protein
VIGLTTTLLSRRQIQPAQAWLPISIPQTYLIDASSPEEVDAVVLIAHLLFLAFTMAVQHLGAQLHRDQRETRPPRASVSSCWIGNLASAAS